MRVSIEDSHTRQGKDIVVYLDDGSRIYTAQTRWDGGMEQYRMEMMLEAVREEVIAQVPEPFMFAVPDSCEDCENLHETIDRLEQEIVKLKAPEAKS